MKERVGKIVCFGFFDFDSWIPYLDSIFTFMEMSFGHFWSI